MYLIEFGITHKYVNRLVFLSFIAARSTRILRSFFNLESNWNKFRKKGSIPNEIFKVFSNITKRVKDFQECNSLMCHRWWISPVYVQFSPIWPVGENYVESGPWLEAMDEYMKVGNKQFIQKIMEYQIQFEFLNEQKHTYFIIPRSLICVDILSKLVLRRWF